MLSIEGLKVAYGHVEALRGIDLEARQGEITAIIGSNGAGKTSTLMAISGLAPISAGDIRFEGQSIARYRPHDITRLGITHILEGRQLFADQTVADNLLLGGYTRLPRHRARVAELIEREMTRFPILRERRAQLAGTLSGGEQQMLAIARGLMSEPRLILMDEPSMGLAPLVVKGIAEHDPLTARGRSDDRPGRADGGCGIAPGRPRLCARKRADQALRHRRRTRPHA